MIDRICDAIHYAWLALRGDPVRSWRKLENGKYMCDGDCGRWKLHGVCTCGVSHYFKVIEKGRDKVNRDTVSWAREGDSEHHMMSVPYREHCPHGVHLNSDERCEICMEEVTKLIEELNQPISNCPRCNAPWYTTAGYCGGCE